MAAPSYLGEVVRNGQGSGSIDLTPLGLQTNDIVLVMDACASNANTRSVGVSTSGYANVAAKISANDTYDCNSIVAWKRMGVTPDTSVTVVATGNSTDARRTTVRAYRGVDATTYLDVAEVKTVGTNGLLFDSGAITPTTVDSLIVVFGMGATVNGGTTAYSAPSDLVDWAANYHNSASFHCAIGVGHKVWAASAFDPEAWTGPSSTNTDSRAGWAIALRPAVAAMSGDAAGSFDVTGAAQATNSVAGQTSGALGLDGSATGTVASQPITGEASGSFDVTGSAAGSTPVVVLYRGDDAPDWRKQFYDRQVREFEESLAEIAAAEDQQDAVQEAIEAFRPIETRAPEVRDNSQAIIEALRGLAMQPLRRKDLRIELDRIRAETEALAAFRKRKRNNEAALLLLM